MTNKSRCSIIDEFWTHFYSKLEGIAKPLSSNTNVGQYHDEVIKLLRESKLKRDQGVGFFTQTDFVCLQSQIEDLTINKFDETSIYKILRIKKNR